MILRRTVSTKSRKMETRPNSPEWTLVIRYTYWLLFIPIYTKELPN